jgi:hypothetical protein
MYETLVRQHDQITHSVPTIDDAIQKLREIEVKKKTRHEEQVRQSRTARAEKLAKAARDADAALKAGVSPVATDEIDGNATSTSASAGTKRKADELDGDAVGQNAPGAEDKARQVTAEAIPGHGVEQANGAATAKDAPVNGDGAAAVQSENVSRESSAKPGKKFERRENTTKPAPQIRGHTSYLTFAFLLPGAADSSSVPATASEAETSYAQVYDELASQDLAGLASGKAVEVAVA